MTGDSARFVDQQESLGDRLPPALALLAVTTLVILFVMTGSVILPIKALAMNLLTISAAFGLLVLVFQDGRYEDLLGYTSQGAIESTQPLVLLAIAFGLSTDYGVFLLTRIKEQHDGARPTRRPSRPASSAPGASSPPRRFCSPWRSELLRPRRSSSSSRSGSEPRPQC